MAGLGKLAKLAWKGISYLPKKAHALQTPFTAPAGGKLSTGKKFANCILKPLNSTANALPYVGLAGLVGGAGTMVYGVATDNRDILEKGCAIASKALDVTIGSALGFVIGGPVGAVAGATYGFLSDKSTASSLIKIFDQNEGQIAENAIKQQRHNMAESVKNFIGLSATEQEAEPEEVSEEKTEKTEQPEQVKEETPEVKADKTAVEKFCDELENIQVGQTVTVPELEADTGTLKMTVGEQEIELNAGDKISRTEDGLEITKANKPAAPEQEVKDSEPDKQPPTQEEKIEEPEQKIPAPKENNEEAPEDNTPTPEKLPPTNNIFGGEINGISTKTLKVDIKGDCLWNIAKRELQKANPNKTITNAQILKQVKEFGRINPEIYGDNPSLKDLDKLRLGQELKLCA